MSDKSEKRKSEPRAGIYSICHTPSLRRYIGQSREVDRRIKVHKQNFQAGNHENPELQRCWNEVGPNEFTFFIIELAPNNLSALALQRWLWEREKKHWMDAGINTFNYQIPELVETQAAIEEYKKEKITETKKSTRRIKDVNTLLEKVKKLERLPYVPISELIQAISELDK